MSGCPARVHGALSWETWTPGTLKSTRPHFQSTKRRVRALMESRIVFKALPSGVSLMNGGILEPPPEMSHHDGRSYVLFERTVVLRYVILVMMRCVEFCCVGALPCKASERAQPIMWRMVMVCARGNGQLNMYSVDAFVVIALRCKAPLSVHVEAQRKHILCCTRGHDVCGTARIPAQTSAL